MGNRKVSSDSNFSGNALRVFFWYVILPLDLLYVAFLSQDMFLLLLISLGFCHEGILDFV